NQTITFYAVVQKGGVQIATSPKGTAIIGSGAQNVLNQPYISSVSPSTVAYLGGVQLLTISGSNLYGHDAEISLVNNATKSRYGIWHGMPSNYSSVQIKFDPQSICIREGIGSTVCEASQPVPAGTYLMYFRNGDS